MGSLNGSKRQNYTNKQFHSFCFFLYYFNEKRGVDEREKEERGSSSQGRLFALCLVYLYLCIKLVEMEPVVENENDTTKESSKSEDTINVFIHSWNMGNAPMNNEMIAVELLSKDVVNTFQIVCFGLQESTYTMHTQVVDSASKAHNNGPNKDLKVTNDDSNSYYNINGSTNGTAFSTPESKQKKASAANDCTHEVQATFLECLGPRFKRVAHLRRGQMQMFMFARDDVQGRISQVEKSVENTGFLGIFPNKGTVNECQYRRRKTR